MAECPTVLPWAVITEDLESTVYCCLNKNMNSYMPGTLFFCPLVGTERLGVDWFCGMYGLGAGGGRQDGRSSFSIRRPFPQDNQVNTGPPN